MDEKSNRKHNKQVVMSKISGTGLPKRSKEPILSIYRITWAGIQAENFFPITKPCSPLRLY